MISIDYERIKNNLMKIARENYLVLKSDAYGFGFKKILEIANKLGFYKYAVLSLEDAIYIKNKNLRTRVLLMGVFDISKLEIYQQHDIEITINRIEEIKSIISLNIKAQIAINTGMNRFGIEKLDEVYNRLKNSPVIITGIFSHSARDFEKEYQLFKKITAKYFVEKHFAASNKIINEIRRIGVAIYEGALKVDGNIIKVNYVKKNDYIGYGYHYQMQEDGYVGVIDLGYADGLERKCSGFKVFINNNFYELVGFSCMNHSFVLLPHANFLNQKVEFIGENNQIDNYISFFDIIKHQIYTSFLKKS